MRSPAGATSPARQLACLLGLRWRLLRGAGQRIGLLTTAAAVGWLVWLALTSGSALDPPTLATAIELAPAAYLGFGVLAVVAPLTSGGGSEIVPPDQLVAYPVRPTTHFLGGLLLAPLNLVWLVQLLALAAMTAYLTLDTSLPRGMLTTTLYVGCITVLGQALAWLVVGLRQTRRGRRLVFAAGAGLLVAAVVTVQSGQGAAALASSPTHSVVQAVGAADLTRWVRATAVLLGLAALGAAAGSWLCGWALGRPGDAGSARHLLPVRRRASRRSTLRELVAVDRASVWRAPALRRGGLVLAVMPGLIAAGAAVPWQSMVILPGLVAAGAGLLFGVNAFCLDGSGALWLASLPSEPRLVARAKTFVLGETVLGAVTIAAVAGSLRSPGSPTVAEVAAIVAAGLACTAVVVAQCMRASVRRPHHALLAGVRDAVAPPGALAFASVRLAVPTACVGVVIATASATGRWWLPIVIAVPIVLAAGLSLNRTLRRYGDPVIRARLVSVVASG
ncbi:MAG: hypothetical protein KY451_06655 [Actinobacteria bacterium]|nr:hypothetical protein [Actinomycetota bacterium]